MRKEKLGAILLLLVMILTIIIPSTVRAQEGEYEWTDFENATLELTLNKKTNTYSFKISNVTLNPNSIYGIYFSNAEEEITKSKILYHSDITLHDGETESTVQLIDHRLEKNEDIYVSILEGPNDNNYYTNSNSNMVVVDKRKLERPELLDLGDRVKIYFWSTSTLSYVFAPHDEDLTRNINVKLGKVTDIQMLKNIKENKVDSYKDLLDYAKSISSYNYTGTIPYHTVKQSTTDSITSKMNLEQGAYYFAYIELDDENGTYFPVEDIALYYAKTTKDLVRYTDEEFTWNLQEEEEQEEQQKPEENLQEQQKPANEALNNETTKEDLEQDNTKAQGTLPQTGENLIFLGILVVVAFTIGIYVKGRKYNDIDK